MTAQTREAALRGPLERIAEEISLLWDASEVLPTTQRHLFLQALTRLSAIRAQVAGLLEP